jgi:ribonuclease VapC
MFIDASALTAMMVVESGSHDLFARVERARTRITSPIAVWETAIAISRIVAIEVSAAQQETSDYLALAKVEPISIPPEVLPLALDAFARYGKGRHPARLNMGDCFAYGCARHFGQPLLYKGEDFALTDIETA